MPALPVPPRGVIQVTILGVNQDAPWAAIQHLKADHTGDPTVANMIALATQIHGEWGVSFCARQNDQVTLESTELEWSDGVGGFQVGGYSNPIPGEDTGEPLDASAAVVVSWRTAAHWRGGHPRTYIAGVSQDRLDGVTRYTGATVSDYQDAADHYLSTINALTVGGFSNVQLGVLRRYANGGSEAIPKQPLSPPIFVPFASAIVRQHIGSQRRRLGHF